MYIEVCIIVKVNKIVCTYNNICNRIVNGVLVLVKCKTN